MSAKPPTPLIRINIDRMTEGLLGEFEALIADWDRTDYDTVDLLKQIRENLKGNSAKEFTTKTSTEILNKWKALHVSVSKFAKTMEKRMKHETIDADILPSSSSADPSRANRVDELVIECLLHHFYRQGDLEAADRLVQESGQIVDAGLKAPYLQLSELLGTLRSGDISPSLQWTRDNRAQLKEDGPRLEFELCRLQYLMLLQQNPNEALRFAQRAFPSLSSIFSLEIQALMGCLAYAHRLASSPYRSCLAEDHLSRACTTLSSAYCKMQRLPQASALTRCIRLGATSLPRIHRVMALMKERKGLEWSQQDELPVEIELSNDLRFHSVFVCPVLKQQTNEENPPMMLPCGHVICQEALTRLSKGQALVRFKCPYCPVEATASQSSRVYF